MSKKTQSKSVFCCNCQNQTEAYHRYFDYKYICKIYDREEVDNRRGKVKLYDYYTTTNYPNKNGNCSHYKRIWWKFWVK